MPASYRIALPVPARVVVLVSGSGTLLQALFDAAVDPQYPARVVGVAADRPGIEGLARAERAGVPASHLRIADFARKEHLAEQLMALISEWNEIAHPFNWTSKSVAKVMAKCQIEDAKPLTEAA